MSLLDIMLAALGASLVVAGVGWWIAGRRDADQAVRSALTDPDPSVRLAAVALVGQRGLAPFASLLLDRLQLEDDPTVVRELVAVVARHQWEPLDSRLLVELRLTALRSLQQNGRLHALVTPGEQISAWGEGGEVVGDAGAARGHGLALAAAAALEEEVISLRLTEGDGEILLVECAGGRGAAAATPSTTRAGYLADRLREVVESPTWA